MIVLIFIFICSGSVYCSIPDAEKAPAHEVIKDFMDKHKGLDFQYVLWKENSNSTNLNIYASSPISPAIITGFEHAGIVSFNVYSKYKAYPIYELDYLGLQHSLLDEDTFGVLQDVGSFDYSDLHLDSDNGDSDNTDDEDNGEGTIDRGNDRFSKTGNQFINDVYDSVQVSLPFIIPLFFVVLGLGWCVSHLKHVAD